MNLIDCTMGKRVRITGTPNNHLVGIIVGLCLIPGREENTCLVAVELEKGYWLEKQISYISVMLAHPDGLIEEKRKEE